MAASGGEKKISQGYVVGTTELSYKESMNPVKISIVIPFHWMENWGFFLRRCLQSIEKQSFTDYEIILTNAGSMPVNTNRAMAAAQGELIKVLYMDDFFAHTNALQEIVDAFDENTKWLVTGCFHQRGNEDPHSYHEPKYTDDIYKGNNTIGSPSVLTMRRKDILFFDDSLSYMLDCDLYRRLHDRYGAPKVLSTANVVIGLHGGQTSVLMPAEHKQKELDYMIKKYA